jgi:hypothetical protein
MFRVLFGAAFVSCLGASIVAMAEESRGTLNASSKPPGTFSNAQFSAVLFLSASSTARRVELPSIESAKWNAYSDRLSSLQKDLVRCSSGADGLLFSDSNLTSVSAAATQSYYFDSAYQPSLTTILPLSTDLSGTTGGMRFQMRPDVFDNLPHLTR